MLDVARAQEVGVQRVRVARLGQRRLRRRQRLPQHLPAEHVLGADVAALAAEQVVLEPLQREQFDQFGDHGLRSEEHTSELQSLMRISYAVFCLQKKNNT